MLHQIFGFLTSFFYTVVNIYRNLIVYFWGALMVGACASCKDRYISFENISDALDTTFDAQFCTQECQKRKSLGNSLPSTG